MLWHGVQLDLPQNWNRLRRAVEANQVGESAARLKFRLDHATTARPMFDQNELKDELQALKAEVSRLLNTTSDGIFDASKTHAEALADQIKAALGDLGETLSEHEEHVENIISERPIAALASAFALGIVVGFMLRRH